MNKVELLGRLTKDPEIRYTQNNTMVASFTLAVNRRFKKEGEQEADFINCVAWKNTADLINKYFKKGQQILVDGRIQTRSYEDNGQKHYITEVVVENVYFTGTKKEEPVDITNEITNDNQIMVGEDDSLPF